MESRADEEEGIGLVIGIGIAVDEVSAMDNRLDKGLCVCEFLVGEAS